MKNIRRKTIVALMSAAIALVWIAAAAPGALAEEGTVPAVDNPTAETETLTYFGSETFYEESLPFMFSGPTGNTYDSHADKLSGVTLAVYSKLKEEVAKIANGDRTNTKITIQASEVGIPEKLYKTDLGLDSLLTANGESFDTAAINAALDTVYGYDPSAVLLALIGDCPYELYWAKHVYLYNLPMCFHEGKYDEAAQAYYITTFDFSFTFYVGAEYAASGSYHNVSDTDATQVSTTMDTGKTAVPLIAKGNAAQIVTEAAGKSDYEKLEYYAEEIIRLADYYHNAPTDGNSTNPWQLIWVFDNDQNTKVVCEGYSRAFQYLCQLTEFQDPNIRCFCVSGTMATAGKSEPHMWNIVRMEDGTNYLVDLTNCDAGGSNMNTDLFMAGCTSGTVAGGYTFTKKQTAALYTYDTNTTRLCTDAELTISDERYAAYPVSGTLGSNLTWKLEQNGTLTIGGTGEMSVSSAYPWLAYRSKIRKVVVENGVSSIGSGAFAGCSNLTSAGIPMSVTGIGTGAFANCGSLTICGYTGAYAKTYAAQNGIPYTVLACTGHIWDAWKETSAATYTSAGTKVHTCTVCGETQAETVPRLKRGLVNENGVFKYYENNKWISDKYAFISYDGRQYLIANGKLARVNGLVQDPNGTAYDWYFCAEGAIVSSHSGFCEYGGEWFLVKNGKLENNATGFYSYDGGLFYMAEGRLLKTANGLLQDPTTKEWYFCSNGQAQTAYTGLALYDGVWFYVRNGKLAESYTGPVTYNGSVFNVVNGQIR